jgi:hypothetical protein
VVPAGLAERQGGVFGPGIAEEDDLDVVLAFTVVAVLFFIWLYDLYHVLSLDVTDGVDEAYEEAVQVAFRECIPFFIEPLLPDVREEACQVIEEVPA